jgi:hypothetical protein
MRAVRLQRTLCRMDASLLTIRLALQECPFTRPSEPILRVSTTCVGALWTCGCVCVGATFDAVAYVGCSLHRGYMERCELAGIGTPRPVRSVPTVKGELFRTPRVHTLPRTRGTRP